MDRNTVIGFVLIGLLMMGMFYFNSKGAAELEAEKKRVADSVERTKPKIDPAVARLDSLRMDSVRRKQSAGAFLDSSIKEEKITTLENDVVRIDLSNKGAQPVKVVLKQYNNSDGKPVVLQQGPFNKISYTINSGNNQTAQTSDLLFLSEPKAETADKSQSASFRIKDSIGREIVHTYTLHPGSYMVDFNIAINGADQLLSQNTLNLHWQSQTDKAESNMQYEKQQTHICFVKDGEYDFEMLGTGSSKEFSKPVDWLAIKQQFFVTSIVNSKKFESADIRWEIPEDTSKQIIALTTANCRIKTSGTGSTQIPLQLYYGPSDYNILNAFNNKMQNIVPYGNGIFAFVKYINRHVLLPVFDLIRKNVASMGIVILLLTLFIRLLTSPILYKSYLSGAKMKALKPELDKLKEKFGDDKQGFGMEQMKLWKSAGVNPLGGCLPALLQIPIFMSLYYFFQSNISLRGQSFLWAKDLSAYDSIYNLPFNIPLYGDHISLFTLTATVTSLLISIYSMSNMQDNSNPVMKYMPYIFPVMLLGVFNGLPSALTWYYTISNTITLILQIVIQNYIIDHDKILAQIEENKKKPVKQSKLQERIQAMQEANKKLQENKKKPS